MPRRRGALFTEGEVNKLIDSFLHPIARQDPYYWVVDVVLHGLVEQDPGVTLGKFVRYSLPKILEQALKEQRRKTRRKTAALLAHKHCPVPISIKPEHSQTRPSDKGLRC